MDGRTVTVGMLHVPTSLNRLVKSEQVYKFLKM